MSATFGNALVTVNLNVLQGSLDLDPVEANWLLAVYVAVNAGANLALIKARTQFGIPRLTIGVLSLHAATSLAQTLWPSYAGALVTRGTSGLVAAALTTLTLYHFIQALPTKARPLAFVVGITVPQVGMPLARLVPPEALALWHGRALHLTELAVAGIAYAVLRAMPLPPSDRVRVFTATDAITIVLSFTALLLVCGVLANGRILWWLDTPWLGGYLAAAVALITIGVLVETGRRDPLVDFRWLSGPELVRFAAVAVLVRLALAEQTYGAVGLLTAGGLNNGQLRTLFTLVAASMLLGITVAALTLSASRLPYQVATSCLLIAAAAWVDSHSSVLTRPEQLYASQALMGFGTSLFLGPALLYGIIRVLGSGPNVLISLVVLFSVSQNVGGLAGASLLGSFQVHRQRVHVQAIQDSQRIGDASVDAQLRNVEFAAAQRNAAGSAIAPLRMLSQVNRREASIRAFNDTFRLVMWIALATAAYVLYRALVKARLDRSKARRGIS